MKLNEKESKKLRQLATSTKGTFLIEYLEKVKNYCADVRNDLTDDIHVRKAACKVIDDLLIQKLKVLAGDTEPASDEWN